MWFLRLLARFHVHILVGVVLMFVCCAVLLLAPAPTFGQPPHSAGAAFLIQQYNPDVGLLRESPETAPNRHWLATDNWLAVRALRAAGEAPFARRLEDRMAHYRFDRHGLIEALAGANIAWPPATPEQTRVEGPVWVERRTGTVRMTDWRQYADLALYGALDAYNEGDIDMAHRRYRDALTQFDGVGFRDKAFDGRHATYKVALALYVGDVLGYAPRADLLRVLRSKQTEHGGFTALYNSEGTPLGDANTETTSYAILALSRLRQGSTYLPFIMATD